MMGIKSLSISLDDKRIHPWLREFDHELTLDEHSTGIRTKAPGGADPAKVAAGAYKVVLENDQVRLLEVRGKTGTKIPLHVHPAYVAYNYFTTTINRYLLHVEESATLLGEAVTVRLATLERSSSGGADDPRRTS